MDQKAQTLQQMEGRCGQSIMGVGCAGRDKRVDGCATGLYSSLGSKAWGLEMEYSKLKF